MSSKSNTDQLYESLLNTLKNLGERKKISSMLAPLRSITRYLYKANSDLVEAVIDHILFFVFFLF